MSRPEIKFDENARCEVWVEWYEVEDAIVEVLKKESDSFKRIEKVTDIIRSEAYNHSQAITPGMEITVEFGEPSKGSIEAFIQYAEEQIAEERESATAGNQKEEVVV